jgi:hypothetical protein
MERTTTLKTFKDKSERCNILLLLLQNLCFIFSLLLLLDLQLIGGDIVSTGVWSWWNGSSNQLLGFGCVNPIKFNTFIKFTLCSDVKTLSGIITCLTAIQFLHLYNRKIITDNIPFYIPRSIILILWILFFTYISKLKKDISNSIPATIDWRGELSIPIIGFILDFTLFLFSIRIKETKYTNQEDKSITIPDAN